MVIGHNRALKGIRRVVAGVSRKDGAVKTRFQGHRVVVADLRECWGEEIQGHTRPNRGVRRRLGVVAGLSGGMSAVISRVHGSWVVVADLRG